MSERTGLSALPFGSAILALMVLSGLILQLKPLSSGRQVDGKVSAHLHSSAEVADARLAEDPIEAIGRHLGNNQSAANRRAQLLTLLKDLGNPVGTPHSSESLKEMRQLQGLTDLRQAVASKTKNPTDVLPVLAVSLRGDHLTEAVELRRRLRTAVTSALARRGFVAKYGGNLPFVLLPFLAEKRRIGFDLHSKVDPDIGFIPVPFEIFDKAATTDLPTTSQSVLVFWLSDQFFQGEEGQAAISELIAAAAPDAKTNLDPILLGPASSSKLEEIFTERGQAGPPRTCSVQPEPHDALCNDVCSRAANIFGRLRIYSNLATARDTLAKAKAYSASDGIFPILADDNQLLEVMAKELRLRSVDIDSEKGSDHLVIITELDTPYGRAMAGYLHALLKDKPAKKDLTGEGRILVRNYFRGIDGEGVNLAPVAVKDKGASKDGEPEAREEAQGRSLYDYLRRLGSELRDQDLQLRQERQKIGAIGIFGSDFYDKQLILQALRPFFPDAIFFTTDLDARFLHPAEQAWNRNLLVASSFDLQLSQPLQGSVPPFRDTYSTSTFLAGLLALGPCSEPDKTDRTDKTDKTDKTRRACEYLDEIASSMIRGKAPEPLLFEIGRTTAVRLKPENPDSPGNPAPPAPLSPAHPAGPEELSYSKKARYYLGIFGLGLLLPILSTRWRKEGRWMYVVGGLFVGLVAFDLVDQIFSLEPALLLEGVSARATELCRVLILVLALAFYLRGQYRLQKSNDELRPFFSGGQPSATPGQPDGSKDHSIYIAYEDLEESAGQPVDAVKAWERYQRLHQPAQPRLKRVMLYILAVICIGVILVSTGLIQYPNVPIRGNGSLMADRFLRYTSLAALGLLAAWCFDVIRLAAAFVKHLANGPTVWPEASRIDDIAVSKGMDRKVLGEYLDIEVIARLTESLAPIILFPFGLTALFIVSRSSVFDAWRWPWLLALVVGVLLAVVLIAATLLWRAAEKARRASLDRLEDLRLQAVAQSPKDVGASEKQLQALIAEIKSNQRGAFAPWTANPLLGSLLLPFGGAGASGLLDFFVHLGL